MPEILSPQLMAPIEREYEAWISREIEDYFDSVGQKAHVWAVSPKVEKYWPADEHLVTDGKVIGLQFKKATMGPKERPDFDRLKWLLNSPPGQFELVLSRPEIFYVLPTFLNRSWRRVSLHHCLFWRPEHGVPHKKVDRNLWYANEDKRVKTRYKTLGKSITALRWGDFYEQVVRCELGVRLDSETTLHGYLRELKGAYDEFFPRTVSEREDVQEEPSGPPILFLVLIEAPR